MSAVKNISGQRFGQLIALTRAPSSRLSGNARWLCLCDCENTTTTSGTKLRTGLTRSCGCRRAKRNQHGSANPNWKGDEAGYEAMHLRVVRDRGKPQQCQRCGSTDPKKDYEWANLTGRYDDVNDYERMCRFCHRQYDNKRAGGGA